MREALIKKREKLGLTQAQMARKCRCTERLIVGVEEDDWITHPKIAAWLAKGYGFGIRMFNQLVHESRREKVLPEPVEPPTEIQWGGSQPKSMRESMERDPYMWKRNKHNI